MVIYTANSARFLTHSAASTATVCATPGTIVRLIISGPDSNQTDGDITVLDNETAVAIIKAGAPACSIEVGVHCATSIKVTLGDAGDEVTVVYIKDSD